MTVPACKPRPSGRAMTCPAGRAAAMAGNHAGSPEMNTVLLSERENEDRG